MSSLLRRLAGATVLMLTAAALPAHATTRVALVIGNSTYKHVENLKNPSNDALAVAAALRRMGFEAVELKRDLSKSDVDRALADFSGKAERADIALVYYAGHGIEVAGRNYLVPVDARLRRARHVGFEAIELAKVMQALEGAAKLRLVILDACRDNPFRERMVRAGTTRSIGRGFARVSPGADTLVAFAAKEGTTADDGTGRHSPFTAALLKHLETPGVEIRLLFGKIRDSVLAVTNQRQEPFTYGSLSGDALYLKQPVSDPSEEASALEREIAALKSRLDSGRSPSVRPKGRETKIAVGISRPLAEVKKPRDLQAGDVFRECPSCPAMVVVPAGTVTVGSPEDESGRDTDEGPAHRVRIARPLAISRFEVTFAEWNACVVQGGCKGYRPDAGRSGGDRHPVTNVSWHDAQSYSAWLSRKTGGRYRLPSEAEWEYAARAGTKTPFATGETITTSDANFDCLKAQDGGGRIKCRAKPTSVGSFAANAFGLYDMHGNIEEWTADVYSAAYDSTGQKGEAQTKGDPQYRVSRGGSWYSDPQDLRSANRNRTWADVRNQFTGFRVVRSLDDSELAQ